VNVVTQRGRRRRLDGIGARVPEVDDPRVEQRAEELIARVTAYAQEQFDCWVAHCLQAVTLADDHRRLAAVFAAWRAWPGNTRAPLPGSSAATRWLDEILDLEEE
jgi:hypothetical protein